MKISFRAVAEGDTELLMAIGPDRQAYLGYGGDPAKTPSGGQNWASAIIARVAAAHWGRIIECDGAFAGEIRLHRYNKADASARLAIGIFRPDLRGLGLGRRAIAFALDTAFGPLGLHRIELCVLQSNHQAIACYTAAGFRHEGVLRDAVRIGDGFAHDVIMSVLSSDTRPALT
ncbi:MAG: GNAT family protein [Pseudomonadota bacterium]